MVLRAQSATEFLITYGWAMLLIIIMLSLLYYFLQVPQKSSSPVCSFQQGLLCQDINLGLNTNSIQNPNSVLDVTIDITNEFQYPILNPSFIVNYNNVNATGSCTTAGPINPGESIQCNATLQGSFTIGQFVAGSLYVPAQNCGTSANYITTHSCSSAQSLTFVGSFSGHAESYIHVQSVKYLVIKLSNLQSTATPSPYQQMLSIYMPTYSNFGLANDLGNIRFFTGNTPGGAPINSWCQANCTSSSAGNTTWWLKMPYSISASSSNFIIAEFLSTNTEYDANVAGEAPTLSPSYGQYDNGANVFLVYDNFYGTTINASKWTYVQSDSKTTMTVANGLTIKAESGNGNGVFLFTLSTYTPPVIMEAYDSAILSGDPAFSVGESEYDTLKNNGEPNGGYFMYSDNGKLEEQIKFDIYLGSSGAVTTVAIPSFTPGIHNFTWVSGPQQTSYVNGVGASGTDTSVALSNYYLNVGVSGNDNGDALVQWVRARAYPPNDIMPSQCIGCTS